MPTHMFSRALFLLFRQAISVEPSDMWMEYGVNRTQDSESETEFVMTLTQGNSIQSHTVAAQMELMNKCVKFQIYTGATINAIPKEWVPDVELSHSTTKLKLCCSTELKVEGSCKIVFRNPTKRKKYDVEFFVVPGKVNPVLGKRVWEQMGVVKVNYGHIQTLHSDNAFDRI